MNEATYKQKSITIAFKDGIKNFREWLFMLKPIHNKRWQAKLVAKRPSIY